MIHYATLVVSPEISQEQTAAAAAAAKLFQSPWRAAIHGVAKSRTRLSD